MPLVHPCLVPGCGTLTMGDRCLAHEQLAGERLGAHVASLWKRFRAPAITLGIAAAAVLAGRASRST
jgi:hypothetical protein